MKKIKEKTKARGIKEQKKQVIRNTFIILAETVSILKVGFSQALFADSCVIAHLSLFFLFLYLEYKHERYPGLTKFMTEYKIQFIMMIVITEVISPPIFFF